MVKEHDRVVLTTDLAKEGLKAGDVGTVVHVHPQEEASEVEFLTLDGTTVAIATVLNSQLRPVTHRDITHARPLGISA